MINSIIKAILLVFSIAFISLGVKESSAIYMVIGGICVGVYNELTNKHEDWVMKEIEIDITVKYRVNGTYKVSDAVAEQLEKIEEKGAFGHTPGYDVSLAEAEDWIADYINENDACDWEYDVELLNKT